ncbi:uncharacterized protein BCR38DRAFT_481049 [Pseudomassariella vexata]|uniref:BTB domain-containing protein n=1 Tax=Pseudomassariella vexata TaxID=1141098 RepID=A0A1Y2EE91_9PEZI|nr:uncharacterized protein BCR38DRAFT_481049 [Pseudomassariella vexata]ORY69889.1 hypothetical protein BCR38DRAFT_481049 [Pseudomassariella vexata]
MSGRIDQDQKLFETGNFADFIVKCDGREWKLHKAILTSRSEWFRRAICGDFKEARENELVLEEKDPDSVHAMLLWVYTKTCQSFDPSIFANEDLLYGAYAELYKTADFFLQADLKKEVRGLLAAHLMSRAVQMAKLYCKNPPHAGHEVFLSDDVLRGLKLGLEVAYSYDFPELHAVFRQIVEMTSFWVLEDAKFVEILDEVPLFAVDIIKLIPRSSHFLHVPVAVRQGRAMNAQNQPRARVDDNGLAAGGWLGKFGRGVKRACRGFVEVMAEEESV